MVFQSSGFGLDSFRSHRVLARNRVNATTSSSSYGGLSSVCGAGIGCGFVAFPTSRVSVTSPLSYQSLIAAFSAKCSVAPNGAYVSDGGRFRWSSFVAESVASISPSRRRNIRSHQGNLSLGRRDCRQMLLLLSSSPKTKSSAPLTYTLAISTTKFEVQGRRVRSLLYRIMKLSSTSIFSWLRRKRRHVDLRFGRPGLCSRRCFTAGNHWAPALHKYFFVMSSPVSHLELSHVVSSKLFQTLNASQSALAGIGDFRTKRSIRIFPRGLGTAINEHGKHPRLYDSAFKSVSSQAEEHGAPEQVRMAEETKEREGQMRPANGQGQFLARGYGWRVRDADRNSLLELMRVADIQTDAFHITAAAFDELFYKLFHAEVLSSLQYKARHSPPDRSSCLLAERDPSQIDYLEEILDENEPRIVGAVDVTAFMDREIVCLLPGAHEYLYISGMAVDQNYRRRSVATLLLEGCLARALAWGFDYMVLHAYEDDLRARNLYSRAGFHTIGGDPEWMSRFLGRRRRIVMARRTAAAPDSGRSYVQ